MAALEPPSPPLHLELVGDVTSSTISLKWKQPHSSGGAPRLGYEIHYRVEVQLPVVGSGLDNGNGGVEQQPKVKVVRTTPTAQLRLGSHNAGRLLDARRSRPTLRSTR